MNGTSSEKNKKNRNKRLLRLLCVFCLLVLGAVAGCVVMFIRSLPNRAQTVSNVQTHEVELGIPPVSSDTAKNVILMIGDGMGAEQVWVAWMCNRGKLNLEKLPVIGFSRTVSASSDITDSAAGGTAIACGQKVHNGVLGINPQQRKLTSVMRCLQAAGKSTGFVVTKAVTDATPAAFYAHCPDRNQTEPIVKDLMNCGCSVIMGGGTGIVPAEGVALLREKGALVRLEGEKHCAPASERGHFLEESVSQALQTLEKNPKGFFLMIEGSQIDTAGHARNLAELVQEVLDFDRTLGVVLRWMQKNPDTLLVVTADHQTGGLSLLGGNRQKGEVVAAFSTKRHSGVAVPIYAAGAGAAAFGCIQENTEFKKKILNACGLLQE